jgi:hypothetical protein
LRKFTVEEVRQQGSVYRGILALLWNISRNAMPASVISHHNQVIDEKGLPRFDYNEKGYSSSNAYRFSRGDQVHEITTGKLAPPSGGAALNYAR